MARDTITNGIIIVVIGGIILFLITNIQTPEVTLIAQNNEKVCPSNLYFENYGEKTSGFLVKLKNTGSDGSIFVTISSNFLYSRANDYDEFQTNSTEAWKVSGGDSQDFDFKLKKISDEIQENISISWIYGCSGKIFGFLNQNCKEETKCCYYEESETTSKYDLIKDDC